MHLSNEKLSEVHKVNLLDEFTILANDLLEQ